MVVLDTSVIIDHLRQTGEKDTLLMQVASKVDKADLGLSVICVQELYEGLSTRKKEKEEYLLATIAPLRILSYTYEIAQLAGEIARDLSHPIELADACIAATTIVNGATLLTLDRKHFSQIKHLNLEGFS